MAILGKIRQQSIFLILIIGMSLFAFVISGVFDGTGASGAPTDPIAVVNDDEISLNVFRQQVEFAERNYNVSTTQAAKLVYDQNIRQTLLEQQYEALGIDAGAEQIEKIVSQNPNIVADPQFQNELGLFDFGLFTDFVARLKVDNPSAYQSWKAQEDNIIAVAKEQIYLDLIKASAGITEQEAEQLYHLENDLVNIEFVRLPYVMIADSLINITDAEIKAYVNQHKSKFESKASRGIQMVIFDEKATQEDIAALRTNLEVLLEDRVEYNDVSKLTDTIEGFKTTKNVAEFLERYSDSPLDSIYRTKGQLPSEYAEILFGLEKNQVFGPYQDGETLKISKLLDRKSGGAIRASHILIAYEGATRASGQVTRSKEEAEQLANRLYRTARSNPDNFETLARENSDGPSKNLGGDLGFFQEGTMAEEFFAFADKNRVGRIGVVETEFGFHVIKVTDKQDVVWMADISRAIVPSEETSNAVFQQATSFEIESKKSTGFAAAAEAKDLEVKSVESIDILDENLPSLPNMRNLVIWAFAEDTAKGDIRRFNLPNGGYVIVELTTLTAAGTISADEVKNQVIPELKKQKRATLLKEKYGQYKSLESLAEATERELETATAVNQNNAILVGAGAEPYIIGAAFGIAENQVSPLLEGNTGVYMIKVTKREKAIVLRSYEVYAEALRTEEYKKVTANIGQALESAATIADNRALYY
ncbi:MAG: peptidylprolyl isomerase [Flavobacteriaceae bacterium]